MNLNETKIRCEFKTFKQAREFEVRHKGNIAFNHELVFWYSEKYTVEEIMLDLPEGKQRANWKGFTRI